VSYHHDHKHTANVRAQFRAGRSPESYAAIVGTVEQNSEEPLTGRSGDHLQFCINVGGGKRYQVDVNTQSGDGTPIMVYIADQDTNPSGMNPDEPFGAPAYGVFPDAQLSYESMGLNDNDFYPLSYYRIDGQLGTALTTAYFVSVYGMTFDDGGPDGKGIHQTHYNKGGRNQDGAVLIYSVDAGTGNPKRTWYFFKFSDDSLPVSPATS
jgi:hypothetical protein